MQEPSQVEMMDCSLGEAVGDHQGKKPVVWVGIAGKWIEATVDPDCA